MPFMFENLEVYQKAVNLEAISKMLSGLINGLKRRKA